MKFEKHDLTNGMRIPAAAMRISGFDTDEAAQYFTLNNSVVVLKKRMNMPELLKAAWSLNKLSSELWGYAALSCGGCEGLCGSCNGECPYDEEDFSEVPGPFIGYFAEAGVCPAALENLLMSGEIVYGK